MIGSRLGVWIRIPVPDSLASNISESIEARGPLDLTDAGAGTAKLLVPTAAVALVALTEA